MVKSEKEEYKTKEQVPEGAGVEKEIEKFIFRGGEIVSFKLKGNDDFVAIQDLQKGTYTYIDEEGKKQSCQLSNLEATAYKLRKQVELKEIGKDGKEVTKTEENPLIFNA